MKLNKLTILIAISLILTLILVILVRENQHQNIIVEYLDREIQKEEARLEIYTKFTENYNELQASYDDLYRKYNEHYIYWQNFVATGYSPNDHQQGTNNICATGFPTDCGLPIIATDPEVIPPYSIVEIKDMGAYISLDVGGAIKGNRIDILFDSKEKALEFGIKELEVRVIK